eukprot:COSAG01_NODE_8106_length_2918_cov_2.369504_3_plen_54_part_00
MPMHTDIDTGQCVALLYNELDIKDDGSDCVEEDIRTVMNDLLAKVESMCSRTE